PHARWRARAVARMARSRRERASSEDARRQDTCIHQATGLAAARRGAREASACARGGAAAREDVRRRADAAPRRRRRVGAVAARSPFARRARDRRRVRTVELGLARRAARRAKPCPPAGDRARRRARRLGSATTLVMAYADDVRSLKALEKYRMAAL